MDKAVERITVVHLDGGDSETVYKKAKRKAKSSKAVKPLEKATRRLLEAQQVFSTELLQQHDKNNRKHKDGWLRDAPAGGLRAARKAVKTLLDD